MAAEFALPVSATFRALAWHVSRFTWHWMTGMLFDSTSLCYYPCSCHAHALEKYVYAPERRGQIRGSDCWCEPLSHRTSPWRCSLHGCIHRRQFQVYRAQRAFGETFRLNTPFLCMHCHSSWSKAICFRLAVRATTKTGNSSEETPCLVS